MMMGRITKRMTRKKKDGNYDNESYEDYDEEEEEDFPFPIPSNYSPTPSSTLSTPTS